MSFSLHEIQTLTSVGLQNDYDHQIWRDKTNG